jgi:hypothetical protein
MVGFGIQDGRGYGPYGTGYYIGPGRRPLPLGPQGQRLGPEYDFRPGPNGSFLPRRLRPLRELPMPLGALAGYDRVGDVEPAELSEADWRREMLVTQRSVRDWQKRWVEEDKRIRYLQIAATLAIPLAAAVWKLILRRGAVKSVIG